MQESLLQFLPLLPEGATWIIPLTLILLIGGWISSISIAVKSKWLALFAIFPLTNPIAVIGMANKNTTKSMIPIGFYALALIVWFTGSSRSYKIESKRLIAYEESLKEKGERIHASDYIKSAKNSEENIWEHPFLKPLADASQPGENGEAARTSIDEIYGQLEFPNHRIKLKYEESSPNRLPMFTPARKLVELSTRLKLNSDPDTPSEDLPHSPSMAARELGPFFSAIQPKIEQLKEALHRKEDVYPFAWDQGFNMLLPHLSKLKNFSQIAQIDSVMHNTLGNSDRAFESAKLAFQLSRTGDSDILISRLVQIAQQSIALETLVTAQNYHAWNDTQWIEIRTMIDSINMIQLMPDSLRAERAMGRSSIEPLLSQNWTQAMQSIGSLDGGGPAPMEGLLKSTVNIIGSNFSRAFLAKQWRLCLEAYSFMIEDLEKSAEASKSKPWREIQISWEDTSLKKYGLFASMLLPALDKAQSRALLQQAKLELAKTTIDLERYFIKHHSYPKTLDALVPDIVDSIPIDPMTGSIFVYKQLSNDSFEIYSAGLNGIDEEGHNMRMHRSNEVPPPDDLLWVIGNATKEIPSYKIN